VPPRYPRIYSANGRNANGFGGVIYRSVPAVVAKRPAGKHSRVTGGSQSASLAITGPPGVGGIALDGAIVVFPAPGNSPRHVRETATASEERWKLHHGNSLLVSKFGRVL
jgi:hypothetical protein